MRVFITGASSFAGYHLAVGFQAAGHQVTASISQPNPSEGIRGLRLSRLAEAGITFRRLDLLVPEDIARCVAEAKPDLWLQHAGYTKGYGSPNYDLATGFAVNVAPLTAIYQAMAEIGGSVIVTGTISEYSDSDLPHQEDESCLPSTAYGLAKLMETLRARQLSLRLGVPTRVPRIFLPFGPLDNPEKLLPSLVTALRAGQRIALSPCLQRRDFIHVDDVVSLYLALAADIGRGGCEIFNACSGESPRLRDVILEIASALGADPALCDFDAIPMRPGEAMVVRGNCNRARDQLNWTPCPWRDAIHRLVSRDD